MKNIIRVGLLISVITSSMLASTYNVDKEHSEIGFKVKHMMISNVKGNFKEFEGEFEYDEEKKEVTSIKGEVSTTTVNTENEKRDKHLKEKDFFDVEKYPKITFESTKVNGKEIEGKLKIKGITQPVIFKVEHGGTVIDPWGNKRAGLTLEGKISRMEFGLTYNSILESGGVAVGDEIKITMEIEGIEKK